MTLTKPGALCGARTIWRALIPWHTRIFRRGRYNALCIERLDDIDLVVIPNVFNGVLLRTGKFLAQTLDQNLVAKDASVLDMGTGSGLLAICAARLGAQVIAVDINPEAVRCAQINVLLNHVEEQVEVRQGDLFAPVQNQHFDVVLFNPPFFHGSPRDALDHAWHSEDAFERFVVELGSMLTPHGYALIVLSSDGDLISTLQSAESDGLQVDAVASQDLINEVLTVYRIKQREDMPQ